MAPRETSEYAAPLPAQAKGQVRTAFLVGGTIAVSSLGVTALQPNANPTIIISTLVIASVCIGAGTLICCMREAKSSPAVCTCAAQTSVANPNGSRRLVAVGGNIIRGIFGGGDA